MDCEESWVPKKLMLLNYDVGEDSWESLGLQGDPTSPSWRRSVLGVHWKDWWWSWNSNTLATSTEELTHWKKTWYWERLGAEGEGDNRGWDGWMASPTWWAWVWVNSRSWWWAGRPGMLWFMESQRVGHDELNWICVEMISTEWSLKLLSAQLVVTVLPSLIRSDIHIVIAPELKDYSLDFLGSCWDWRPITVWHYKLPLCQSGLWNLMPKNSILLIFLS